MYLRILFSLIIFTFSEYVYSCASCGCILNSNWPELSEHKFEFDLRYDYIDQDQLRSGKSKISPIAASKISTFGNPQEVEHDTANTYITANFTYNFNEDWNLGLMVPNVNRNHSTLGTASDGIEAGAGGGQYSSHTSNLGDIKLISRYLGLTEQHDLGLILGLKLPTGSHTLNGNSNDVTSPGPITIDRGLQPGTGTTDLIFGTNYSRALNKNWDYYGDLIYQLALNAKDEYRPGNSSNLSLGLRYMGFESMIPQFQLNSRYIKHDTGINADTISTGGFLVYLGPGLITSIGKKIELYGFVQIPVYQDLNGVQLAPTITESLGARFKF